MSGLNELEGRERPSFSSSQSKGGGVSGAPRSNWCRAPRWVESQLADAAVGGAAVHEPFPLRDAQHRSGMHRAALHAAL